MSPPSQDAHGTDDGPSARTAELEELLVALIRAAADYEPRDPAYGARAQAFLTALREARPGPRGWNLEAALPEEEGGGTDAAGELRRRLAEFEAARLWIQPQATAVELHALATALVSGDEEDLFTLAAGSLSAIQVERFMEERSEGTGTGDVHHIERPLDEVLGFGAHVLQNSMGNLAGDGLAFDDLEEVFEAAEDAIARARKDHRTGAAPRAEPQLDPEQLRRDREAAALEPGRGLSVAELRRELEEFTGPANDPMEPDPGEGAEELSILLQLALDSQAERVPPRLRHILRVGLTPSSRDVWWGAMTELLERGTPEVFDRVFPLFARYHRVPGRLPLADQIAAAAQGTSEQAHETLWPHAANELLIARRERGQVVSRALVELVASLPAQAMEQAMGRLCRLEAVAGRMLAPDAFNARQRPLYPLFANLLLTPIETLVGRVVLRGLRVVPPPCEGAVVLPVLKDYRLCHTELLYRILMEDGSPSASPELLQAAEEFGAQGLGEIDDEDREEPWVVELIEWLGLRRCALAHQALQRVVGERRALVVHAWPATCRRAARAALARIEERAA